MPKYTYECTDCDIQIQKFANVTDKTTKCPKCHEQIPRRMPLLKAPKVTEVVDKYSNKKHMDNHKNVLQERKLDYYWKHEVPKFVESGTYELDTMLEQGWVYYDEKGNLTTRTKPPQKT